MGVRDVREPAPEPGPRPDEAVPSPTVRPERRLAAIMAADVVGYSRLIEEDETGTLARLKAHRTEFIEPLVAEHHGRIVKLMGDGALCEFGSVVDAVACAVAIQRGMPERELAVPEEQRIRFRINLGDVIHETDGDIYGDGVNFAARLEQLCAPCGVTLSGTAYDHLQGKLGRAFLGERNVKNISRPVRVYRIDLKAEPGFGAARGRAWRGGFRPWAWSAAAGAVLLLGGRGRWPLLVPSGRSTPSRAPVRRRAPVHEHEQRSGSGILVRWDQRGPHHGPIAISRAARDRPELHFPLQGAGGRHAARRRGARRSLPGRRRPAGRRRAGAGHRPAG
jgi:class 3 adenylate cyclase